MAIDKRLVDEAKSLATRINGLRGLSSRVEVTRGMSHVISVLTHPSRAKLQNVVATVRNLCVIVDDNPGIVNDLQRLSRGIESLAPSAKKVRRRRHRQQSW